MTNVTIYSNTAENTGGGLYLAGMAPHPINSVTEDAIYATISRNKAIMNGGNLYSELALLTIKNVLLADGQPNNCAGNPGPGLVSADHNLDSDDTCGLTQANDLHPADAKLAPFLANNGGKTPTVALLPGSDAIDAGTCAAAPPFDQRGVPRPQPQGGECDIGAFELTTDPWLALDKTVDDDRPSPGQMVTFTLQVINSGGSPSLDSVISDTIPDGLRFVSSSITVDPPPAGTVGTPPTLLYDLDLPPGKGVTVTFEATVNADLADTMGITNTASATSTNFLSVATDSQVIVVQAPVLALSKEVDDQAPEPGTTLTYTVVVVNRGSGSATGATISDTIPAGLHYVDGSATLDPPSAGTVGTPPELATGVTVSPGESVTITFAVTVSDNLTDGTVITNTADVSSTEATTLQSGEVAVTISATVTAEDYWIYLPLVMHTYP